MVVRGGLHVNQRFLMDRAALLRPQGRVLDFGSGHGVAVDHARSVGLDAWGTDLRDRGASDRFRQCTTDRLPFDDGEFDVIVSNMVLEHVSDLPVVLAEWRRVLRSDGLVLALWPVRETWWEGHVRLPFAHRFRRPWYLATLKRCGLGVATRAGESPRAFAERWLTYLDDRTHYRSLDADRRAFAAAGFTFERIERHYVAARWGRRVPFASPILSRLLTVAVQARPTRTDPVPTSGVTGAPRCPT